MGNIDKQKLINSIISSSGGKLDKASLEKVAEGDMSGLMSSLSEEDRNKLNSVLKDKNKAKEMLSSSAARELLKRILGNG